MNFFSVFSWHSVRAALNDIRRCHSYYLGGTLCVDMSQGYSIGLNRNGRGFAFMRGGGREYKFLMPRDVEQKVNELYRELKGK